MPTKRKPSKRLKFTEKPTLLSVSCVEHPTLPGDVWVFGRVRKDTDDA